MARNLAKEREVLLNEDDLDRMIASYVDLKEEEKTVKEDVSNLNVQIKSLMQELKINERGPAKIVVQTRESFNEEAIIELLKENKKSAGIVKKKEYIDWDAMEDAIYKGKIDTKLVKEMDKFKTVTETPTLRISKKK